jgi:hypothetical protein
MNVIESLQSGNNYIMQASKALEIDVETIDIDCSHGETDRCLILFFVKNNFTFNEAFAILTMKQKMLSEEWEDLDLYNEADVTLWSQILAKEYASSTYSEKVTDDEFLNDHLIHRLQLENSIQSIFYNDKQISFINFQKINPIKTNLIRIAKSMYKRLETEYYIETEIHFVLFNWYTTA